MRQNTHKTKQNAYINDVRAWRETTFCLSVCQPVLMFSGNLNVYVCVCILKEGLGNLNTRQQRVRDFRETSEFAIIQHDSCKKRLVRYESQTQTFIRVEDMV